MRTRQEMARGAHMRVLVVGEGGREHALAWKIGLSPLVEKVYCAPGNAGIRHVAECVPIAVTDMARLAEFAERERIDLTVIGPEAPLIAGVVDLFESRGLPVFGPSREPARIEGSKAFAKKLMFAAGIPTASYTECHSLAEARAAVKEYYERRSPSAGVVVKVDGLAAGKGVTVARSQPEAEEAIELYMARRIFGAAGDSVVVEERLEGEEASIMAITDGETVVPLVPSQDHKRIGDGDMGPNTGGMGAYTPVPIIPDDTAQIVVDRIIRPAIAAIRELGIPYRGVLYAGIMVTTEGPKCIEFNCRLGDPETQAVLPMLDSDIVPLLLGATDCSLDASQVKWRSGAAVCVVAATRGYPLSSESGVPILGLADAGSDDCLVFHAGTRVEGENVVTGGGRVLSVTGLGDNLVVAAARAYAGLGRIDFDGMQYRRDIAGRALTAG